MNLLNNIELAEKIRKLGRARGLMSDAAICDAAGIKHRMTIKNIELAKNAPRLDIIIKLASALNVAVDVLVHKDLQEIDNETFNDITTAIDKFLIENKAVMSAKKRQEIVKDFYNRGLTGEDIIAELSKYRRWNFGKSEQK